MAFTSGRPVGLSLPIFCLFYTLTHAVNLDVVNQCSYTVWAAARPGGGRQLDPGQTWSITVASGSTLARIWGRTNCSFDGNGRGNCQTCDCNNLLECQGYGTPPNTLAEFALNYQTNNVDLFDISLVDGFNIPLDLSPTTSACRGARCAADINGQCPDKLRTPGGCNSPCNVFKTNQYCCTTGSGSCAPTEYSRFFKNMCPDAYSNSQDDQTSGFSCPSGTNYRVVFCP